MSDIELGTIDEVTGMPALPVGFYWRVKWISYEDIICQGYIASFCEPGMDVRIVEDMKVMKTERHTVFMYFTRSYTYEKTETFTRASGAVMYQDLESSTPPHKKDTDFVKLHEVTSNSIQKAALRVFERWNAEREAKALQGDYPPMKLQVSDD